MTDRVGIDYSLHDPLVVRPVRPSAVPTTRHVLQIYLLVANIGRQVLNNGQVGSVVLAWQLIIIKRAGADTGREQ